MSEEALINFIAVSESTPGPFAVNISTYVGSVTGGFWGAVCATLGVVTPSFFIILLVAKCFQAFQNSSIVRGAMTGLRPAVVGLIAAAVVSVGKTALFPNGFSGVNSLFSLATLYNTAIFLLMLYLGRKKLHPILIISLSAVLGIAGGLCSDFFGLTAY